MRTQKEILDKIEKVEKEDFLGVMFKDLAEWLTYENAKQFLTEEATKESWENSVSQIM